MPGLNDRYCVEADTSCRAAYYREYRRKNAARLREYHRERGKTAKGKAQSAKSRLKHRERRLADKKAYRLRNVEKAKAQCREWRKRHPDRARQLIRAWRIANPERYRQNNRNHKARRRKVIGTHTAQDIREIRALQKGLCAYCRAKLSSAAEHVDHIKPIKLGGSNGKENLQLLCVSCNLAKGAKDPVEYAQSLGLLI